MISAITLTHYPPYQESISQKRNTYGISKNNLKKLGVYPSFFRNEKYYYALNEFVRRRKEVSTANDTSEKSFVAFIGCRKR